MAWSLNLGVALLLVYGCASAELPSRSSQKDGADEGGADNGDADGTDGDNDANDAGEAGGEEECANADCLEGEKDVNAPPAEFSLVGSYGRMSRQPWIRWASSKGADSYDVKITKDKDCKDVVVEKKGLKITEVRLKEVDTGDAFLCVSATGKGGSTRAKSDGVPVKVVQGWVKASTEGWESPAKLAISTVWTGTEMITFGGVISTGNDAQNDLHAFDPSADRWRKIELKDPKPPVRFYGLLGYHAGKLWIAKSGDLAATGDYVVDLKTGVRSDWGGDNKPTFAQHAALAVVGDRFFRYGGAGHLTKGYWFDPKSGAWTAQAGDGPVNRQTHCMVASDKEIIVFGSSDSGEAMNLETGTWRTLPAPTPSLSGTTAPCGWDGKYMYRYNGSAAGRLDVEAGVWETIDLTGGPPNRGNSTGTWVGEAFAVVGGTGTNFETYLYYP